MIKWKLNYSLLSKYIPIKPNIKKTIAHIGLIFNSIPPSPLPSEDRKETAHMADVINHQ